MFTDGFTEEPDSKRSVRPRDEKVRLASASAYRQTLLSKSLLDVPVVPAPTLHSVRGRSPRHRLGGRPRRLRVHLVEAVYARTCAGIDAASAARQRYRQAQRPCRFSGAT